jgi:hypothetical protein
LIGLGSGVADDGHAEGDTSKKHFHCVIALRSSGGEELAADLRWKLAIIVVVIGVSVWFTFPLGQRINLGLTCRWHAFGVGGRGRKAVDSTIDRLVVEVSEGIAKLAIPGLEVRKVASDQLVVKLPDAGRADAVAEAMKAFGSLVPAERKGNRAHL